MARKLRFERAGGLYHVLNRGDSRSWIFETPAAKESFEKSLSETCERSGWVLHAYCIMGNHYHLALETPEPNLSEGMRLLQSMFSIRFNSFSKEKGQIFQGRFKSVVVEDWERLGWLCHYINLNPVRAGICSVEELRSLDHCSYRYLWDKRKRPSYLNFEACLGSAGALKDASVGRRKYAEYLSWLCEDEPAQKSMLFDTMSKGWVMGSKGFKIALLEDEKKLKASFKLGAGDAKEILEFAWETKLERCLKILKADIAGAADVKKSEDWKVAIAGYLKGKHLCRNGWLAEKLEMGTEYGVSRYVAEMLSGKRADAKKLYDILIKKIKD